MHIHFNDQDTGATLIMCVERETNTCIILRGAPELVDNALAVAESMKTGIVRMVVHKNVLEELRALGWVLVEEHVVVEKRFSNGSAKGVNPDGKFKTPSSLV